MSLCKYDELDALMSNPDIDKLSLFTAAYRAIKEKNENEAQMLRYFLEANMDTDEETESGLVDNDVFEYNRSMTLMIITRISNLNEPEDEFYARLWELLNSSCYTDDTDRGYALMCMAGNVRLPYHQVGQGMQMSAEMYRQTTKEILETVLYGIQILLRSQNMQRTQTASLLLEQMDKLQTREHRTVFLTHMMTFVAENYKNQTPKGCEEANQE